MSAHWFDRLARIRAASSPARVGGSGELTRRDALTRAGAATLSLGALGALGAIPPAVAATPAAPTIRARDAQLAACGACNKRTDKNANAGTRRIAAEFLKSVPTPAVGAAAASWIIQMIVNEAARYSGLRGCANGPCNPQSYSPAPSATPATEVETGAPICPGGTHDCGVIPGSTTHYCCFGSDVCCNGTCCIEDVGCACAPS
jgi:hypothetical protein